MGSTPRRRLASSHGSSYTEPTSKEMLDKPQSSAWARAASTTSADRSRPTTRPARRARPAVMVPVPQPMSSTSASGRSRGSREGGTCLGSAPGVPPHDHLVVTVGVPLAFRQLVSQRVRESGIASRRLGPLAQNTGVFLRTLPGANSAAATRLQEHF